MKTSPYNFVRAEMERYKKRFRIPSARLTNWDYSSHGLYFVTICTKDKENYLGEINSSATVLHSEPPLETQETAYLYSTEIGEIAFQYWKHIPEYHPFVELDEFIVMPNHVHGIIFINNPDRELWQVNKFGPQ